MLRSEFDNHTLWNVLDRIDGLLGTIIDEHVGTEQPYVERIKTQMAYVRGFDAVASTRAAFFHTQMLASVQTVWESVESSLSTRVANGAQHTNYLVQGADQSETGLLQMAAWPRAYGKGGEVKQMHTLFEQLLEAQRISIEALDAEHVRLREEVADAEKQIEVKRDEVQTEVVRAGSQLNELTETIESQKAEIATAVADAEAAVEALTTKNSASYKEWREGREAEFAKDFQPLRDRIARDLEAAHNEYEDLIGAKEKYTKLVSAIAADEVASQFEVEATWGRRLGNRYYLVGFALLLVATVPLVVLLFDSGSASGAVDWTQIISRLAFGALAGSAATVAIRLGSRLINSANATKRMELELRAIGPFLANVSEKPMVDNAFVDLVSKAFGNTYNETKSALEKDAPDDRISATAMAQFLDVLEKARKMMPPGQTTS